ncbi:barstar family protein [Streptomyces sp. NBC_01443]|uniref:barstar family protein n=1 Tax=Streptomyces sp. NBC_01443 TaxID=2903868 RepID=UPI002253F3A6|nr:barstar family protein [Streptomyces sp. NBC_01443]MCX4630959.1 barstar family protein [Streptomyces sp. NBC_01443]WSW46847.1 barstar family protein [Streptomyces sp. NBC_01001]
MTLHPQPLAPAVAAAEKAGWTTLRVDLAGVRGKAELMRRWGAALAVPAWFGGNWDALADALIDLSWLPEAPGRLVAVTSWSSYAGARPGDWETLQEVLEGAVEYWRDAGEGALAVLLAEPPPAG